MHVRVCVCTIYMPGAYEVQKASAPFELELQTVNHHVGGVN